MSAHISLNYTIRLAYHPCAFFSLSQPFLSSISTCEPCSCTLSFSMLSLDHVIWSTSMTERRHGCCWVQLCRPWCKSDGLRLARTQVFLFIGHAALMLLVQNGRVDARKDTDLFVYRETWRIDMTIVRVQLANPCRSGLSEMNWIGLDWIIRLVIAIYSFVISLHSGYIFYGSIQYVLFLIH